jgi:hypothetical protein
MSEGREHDKEEYGHSQIKKKMLFRFRFKNTV